MVNSKVIYLSVAFLTAIVVKSGISSINLAESILGVAILAFIGANSYLEASLAKEVSKDVQINADIKILEERLKSVESRSNMQALARSQQPR